MTTRETIQSSVVIPEDDPRFRLAQLVLLLLAMERAGEEERGYLERLAYYDFLSAHPFLLVKESDSAWHRLILAGFDARVLAYASPGQRFATRRERLQHDLSLLVAYGLALPDAHSGNVFYRLTPLGRNIGGAFHSMYARAYAVAADVVIARLKRTSDQKLRREASDWLTYHDSAVPPDVMIHLTDAALQHADVRVSDPQESD